LRRSEAALLAGTTSTGLLACRTSAMATSPGITVLSPLRPVPQTTSRASRSCATASIARQTATGGPHHERLGVQAGGSCALGAGARRLQRRLARLQVDLDAGSPAGGAAPDESISSVSSRHTVTTSTGADARTPAT
jgi:hypothetical protein